MKIKQIKSEGLSREYDITVPAENINGIINQRLELIGKDSKISGFRPGKTPLSVLKKLHGKRVLGEALETVVQMTSKSALDKEKLRPAIQPQIEITRFEEGKDLEYKMKVEVLPEVPEMDFSKITIEKPVAEIEESEIMDAIKRIAAQHRHFHPIKDNRAAKKGDAVIIDFKGFVGDEAFEGGEAKGHQLEIGSGAFIPGFEEQLIGLKAGEEKDVNVSFPKEYHSKNLAGKKAKFEVKLHEIKEVETHEKIDDEFGKHLGFENLDKLKEAVREQIKKETDDASHRLAKKALFDAIDEKCDFSIPPQMLKNEFDIIWQQFEQAKKQSPNAEEFKKPEKELKQEYEEMAKRRVRLGIMLSETGRRKNIQVKQEDIQVAVMKEARKYPGQEQAVIDYYSDRNNVESLRGPVLEEKVTEFILSKVKINEKKLTMDEMRAYEDEGGDKKPNKKKVSKKKPETKKKTTAKKKAEKKGTKK